MYVYVLLFRYHIHGHCGLLRTQVIVAGVLSVGQIHGVISVDVADR